MSFLSFRGSGRVQGDEGVREGSCAALRISGSALWEISQEEGLFTSPVCGTVSVNLNLASSFPVCSPHTCSSPSTEEVKQRSVDASPTLIRPVN